MIKINKHIIKLHGIIVLETQ